MVVEDSPACAGPSLTGLRIRIAELERELADARRRCESAREEARVLDQRVKIGDQVLADVFNSLSWRLTQPLRTAKHSRVRVCAAGRRTVNQGGART